MGLDLMLQLLVRFLSSSFVPQWCNVDWKNLKIEQINEIKNARKYKI